MTTHSSGPTGTRSSRRAPAFGTICAAADPMFRERRYADIAEATRASGFLLVEDVRFTDQQCEEFCSSLGRPVVYDDKSIGYGYEMLLTLDGSSDPTRVVSGQGPMPLHSDGVLFKNRVDVVFFYCLESDGSAPGDSATIVCDQRSAVARMPRDLIEPLVEHGLEYYTVERGFFTVQPDAWFPVPATLTFPEGTALNVALPFADDAPAAWRTRVAGMPEPESRNLLARLDGHLRRDPFLYAHDWRVGDLLLIDNRLMLHGRTAIRGCRRLLNGQVNVDGWR